MINKYSNIFKSKFVKNVLVMVTGAAGAQAVTMAFTPFITRIYGPEAFGIMGTFVAFINIVIPISALTYPTAIVLPKKNSEALTLVKLSVFISILISTFILVLLILFNSQIVSLFQLQEISSFLFLLPIVIIFAAMMQVSQQWLIRTNQFSINAKANFIHSVVINIGKLGAGMIHPVASVLVILTTLGNGLRAILMIILNKKPMFSGGSKKKNKDTLYSISKKYKDFPLYRTPEVFISAISQSLPVLLLTALFGPASAGFYSIGRTVLSLPSALIGNSIGDVFYPRITEAANKGEDLSELIKKATISLLLIGTIPFGLVIFFGPFLFEFVFGSGWETAGEYARWISLASFSVFINKPSVKSMPVLSAQRFHLIFTIVMLFTRVLALYIGFYLFNSDIVAVALFAITGTILNIVLINITIKLGKKY